MAIEFVTTRRKHTLCNIAFAFANAWSEQGLTGNVHYYTGGVEIPGESQLWSGSYQLQMGNNGGALCRRKVRNSLMVKSH